MFRRVFRGRDTNIEDAIRAAYAAIGKASHVSLGELTNGVGKLWDVPIGEEARWFLLVEFYLFYIHVLDWTAFEELGETGRDAVMDGGTKFGLEPFVRKHWPDWSKEDQNAWISRLIISINDRNAAYVKAPFVFARLEKTEPADPYVVPGFEDTALDEPIAKVTLLAEAIYGLLMREVPGYGKSNVFPGDISFLMTFAGVQGAVAAGFTQSEFLLRVREIHRHLG